jgi:hypothetical protein
MWERRCTVEWQTSDFHFQHFLRPTVGHPNYEAVIKKLLFNDLRIDGFAYPFAAFPLKTCDTEKHHESAIAILRATKLRPTWGSSFVRGVLC